MAEPPKAVSLRPETEADQDFLLEVYAATRDDLNELSGDNGQTRVLVRMQFTARQRQYRERYPAADASIVLLDGRPIGRMLVSRSKEALVLVDIALVPEQRNAGIGSFLIQELLEESAAAGTPVRLRVLKNSRAVPMYERLGFSPTAADGAYLDMTWTG